jgi:hypothetical protein
MDFQVGDKILLHIPSGIIYPFSGRGFNPKSLVATLIEVEDNNYAFKFNSEDIPTNVVGLHTLNYRIKEKLGWWLTKRQLEFMRAQIFNDLCGPLPRYHTISLKVKALQKKFEERQHVTG